MFMTPFGPLVWVQLARNTSEDRKCHAAGRHYKRGKRHVNSYLCTMLEMVVGHLGERHDGRPVRYFSAEACFYMPPEWSQIHPHLCL